jgi:hypothetical protein
MAERASVFQTVQIGVESGYGTKVAADVKLPSIAFEMGPESEIQTYRGAGYKYPSVAALTKEWASASFSGPITYNEIVYLLASVLDYAAPTDNTGTSGEATWTFTPDPDAADAPKSYTIEQGGAGRAHLVTGALVTGLTLTFNQDGAELGGDLIAKALDDGITMTASPDELDLVPVTRPQTLVTLDDTWAGLGTTELTRVLSVEWGITDRYGPVWVLNGEVDFEATVETVPTLEVKLLVEADAQGMGLLTTMRANSTKFLRIEAIGPVISGIITHKLTIDTAVKVTDVERFSDEDGIYAIEWTMQGVLDPTTSKVTEVKVVNTVGSL